MNFERLFEMGQQAGLSDMEVYLVEDENFSCKVFEQEVDSYSVSTTKGLSLRGIYQGKMGYTYTENVDDSEIDFLIKGVIHNASIIENDDKEEIYEGSANYTELNLYHPELEEVSVSEKINFLKALESECLNFDPRVKSVNYCMFSNGIQNMTLKNSKGLDLQQKQNHAYSYVSVLVTENDENKTDNSVIFDTDFTKYDPKSLAKKVVTGALAQLGATKIKSGSFPILLKNTVAAQILSVMCDSFSAENVQKDLSHLKGKLNEEIANPLLSILDDPHLEKGMGSAAFDDEGVATYPKEVVANGVLQTYLHSLTTAKAFDVPPTGNGFRSGFKSAVTISPSNMYIKPGKSTFEELVNAIGDGIYITDVQGLHAGLNSISGDFSLSASGFLIKDGSLQTPVDGITIADNFFTVLQKIKGIGNDLKFEISPIGAPSLWIKSLTVSGE